MSATPSTPATEGNKRELSSPFDPNDTKKVRANSETSDTGEMGDMGDTVGSTHLRLCDEDIVKITALMKTTLKTELSTMVADVVNSVVFQLNTKVDELESKNKSLETRVTELEARLLVAETKNDRSDQYSRRNLLRICGIPEKQDESTDQIVLEVAEAVGAQITIDEIDRSHRARPIKPIQMGRNSNTPRPRDIIVKFVSYRARSKLQTNKSKLKDSKFKGVFVNEDLTRTRSLLFQKARNLVKEKRVNGTWTIDGVIIIKDKQDRKFRIETAKELNDLISKLTA